MPIPQNITPKHLIMGIEMINNQGYQSSRRSDDYDVYFNGRKYPPKVVISYANLFANGEELSPNEFHGGPESNYFLTKSGFPILRNPERNPHDFFTIEELTFFNEYSGKPYNSNDTIHQNAATYISNVIWEHSKHWADIIASSLTFRRSGKKTWNEMVNNEFGQRFRPYSWYKLHHTEYNSNNVFYTVGVEGPRPEDKTTSRLVIKLDCARTKISNDLETRFDNLLEQRGINWRIFSVEELGQMNWSDLLTLSAEFINNTIDTLKEAVDLIENNIETKFARITWNNHGWIRPTGRDGKSKTENHEKQYGYGHEEWLFDLDKIIDGYHYSRLEPLKTDKDKHVGKIYNLGLYSHNEEEKLWYHIATISNVEVISAGQSEEIAAQYVEKKWFVEQLVELKQLDAVNAKNFEHWPVDDRYNIRFRPEDVNINQHPFLVGEHPGSTRYILLGKISYTEAQSDEEGSPTPPSKKGLDLKKRKGRKSKKSISRTYEAGYSELENIHGLLQDALVEYLENEGREIFPEGIRNYDNRRIDIVERAMVGTQERYIFYEIKTYPSVLHSIRVAIGQLLEYAYYPDELLTKEFVIVSHLPANEEVYAYLKHISAVLGVNFRYMHFDYVTKKVIR